MCFPFFFLLWVQLSKHFLFLLPLRLSLNFHSCASNQKSNLSSWTRQVLCVLICLLGTKNGNIYFCGDCQSIRKIIWLFSAENHSVIMGAFWCVHIRIHLPRNQYLFCLFVCLSLAFWKAVSYILSCLPTLPTWTPFQLHRE